MLMCTNNFHSIYKGVDKLINREGFRINAALFFITVNTFFLLSVPYSFSYYKAIDLLWFEQLPSIIPKSVSFLWIGTIFLSLLGFYNQWIRIGHFVCTSFLLTFQNTTFTVEELFYLLLSLTLALTKFESNSILRLLTDRKKWIAFYSSQHIDGIFIYIMGLVYSFHLFSAGYTKCLDPLWVEGYGLYYTFLLPWIKDNRLSFLLDYKTIMLLLNYLALIFEISVLPLYLFARTRKYAIIQMLIFGILLIYPFNGLSFIGFFGTVISLLLISLYPYNQKESSHIGNPPFFHKSLTTNKYATLLLVYVWIAFVIQIGSKIIDMRYPFVHYPLKIEGITNSKSSSNKAFKAATALFNFINKSTYRVSMFNLFNAHHTLGIYEYQIKIHMKNGETLTPIMPFNNDKSKGDDLSYLSGLWYETQMYHVSNLAHKIVKEQRLNFNKAETQKLRGLVTFSMSKVPKHLKANIKTVVIYASPLLVPMSYAGNFEDVKTQKWKPFFGWNQMSNSYFVSEIPQLHNLKYKIAFRNQYITL